MKHILAIILLLFLVACSKKPQPTDSSALLLINLSQSALTVGQVDSAEVSFRKVNSNETRTAKFIKLGTSLSVLLEALTPGTWTAQVEVYTKAVNKESNQYKTTLSILVGQDRARLEVPGPGTTSGFGWLKRHVKASVNNDVVVIVSDDVYDTYFEFRAQPGRRYSMGIQREAVNVNYLVKVANWNCTSTCLNPRGQLVNSDHFMPFAQTILSSPWTRNVITISVLNDQQESILEYDRNWLQ